MAELLASVLRKALVLYCGSILVMPVFSVFQERRVWKPAPLPSLSPLGHVKVYLFNVVWMTITLVGGLFLLPRYALGRLLGFDCQVEAHRVEAFTALVSCLCLVCPDVEVRGIENLPAAGSRPAPVIVANHSSQVDIAAAYFLGRRFKWISKDSVRYLPGLGLIMTLSQHVFIVRRGKNGKNSKSVSNLYKQSNEAVRSGLPVFFFPQGTRSMSARLPFKDGAYRVALENGSDLVPVSICIPRGCWNSWYPLCLLWGGEVENVVLTVHEPIRAGEGRDKEDLKKSTYDAIFGVMPPVREEANGHKKEG